MGAPGLGAQAANQATCGCQGEQAELEAAAGIPPKGHRGEEGGAVGWPEAGAWRRSPAWAQAAKAPTALGMRLALCTWFFACTMGDPLASFFVQSAQIPLEGKVRK